MSDGRKDDVSINYSRLGSLGKPATSLKFPLPAAKIPPARLDVVSQVCYLITHDVRTEPGSPFFRFAVGVLNFWEFPLLELCDPVSSGSHYLTSFCAIFATVILRRLTTGGPFRRLSVTIFGLTMILLYAASGTFHAIRLPIWQKIDQSAVYAFIAGSYTPMMVILLRGRFRQVLLISMWTLAALGVACLWLFPKPPHSAMVGFYIGMGWLGLMGSVHYFRATGLRGMKWVLDRETTVTFHDVAP